ncbi:MAG: ribosome maturation factor RimP [Thermoanaerobaculia bacterium]|nr:ribosome maturation factor RimP [Thermoanaerobaculia bacterium]
MRLSDTTNEEIRAIAAEQGCRLLAVESAGAGRYSVLRLVLERAGGESVTLEECESVSRAVSALLDANDEVAHRYTLEVSSAGLDRKLYTLDDAARFVGQRVRVQTTTPVTPEPSESERPSTALPARNLRGELRSVAGDVLTIVDEENRKIYNVRFGDIRSAKLDFPWPQRGR